MIEIGRVCVKIAGRDAGEIAVVVDVLNDKYVLIDGNVRRRKCNIRHIEPTDKVLKIKKNATTEEILKAMKKAGIEVKKKIKKKEKEAKKQEKPKEKRESKK